MSDSWDDLVREYNAGKLAGGSAAKSAATASPDDEWKAFGATSNGATAERPGFFQRFAENTPLALLHDAWSSAVEHAGRAQEEFKAGNYGKAATHAALALPVMSSIASLVQNGPAASVAALNAADVAKQQGDTAGRVTNDIRAVPLVGAPIANAIQDARDENYAGLAGGVTGAATTALLPKVPGAVADIAEGVKQPGVGKMVGGGAGIAAGAGLTATGHTYAGPSMMLSGAGAIVKGVMEKGKAAEEAATEARRMRDVQEQFAARQVPATQPFLPRDPELAPRDPVAEMVRGWQQTASPAPEVRAQPTTPPPTGPQATPAQHPVHSMPMTALDSEAIQSIRYHPESQTALIDVRGRQYQLPMTPEMHGRILAASADPNASVGTIWNKEIRPTLQTKSGVLEPKAPAAQLPETTSPTMEQRLAASPDAFALRQQVLQRATGQHLNAAQYEALAHQIAAEINTARAAGGNARGIIPAWVVQDVARGFK